MPQNPIKIIDWEDWKDKVPQGTLDSNEVDLKVIDEEVSEKPKLPLEDFVLTLKGSANFLVSGFNSADDEDDDGILAAKKKDDPGTEISPQILFDKKRAWLRYRLEGKLAAEGNLDMGDVGLSIDASKTAILSDYRIHRPDEKVVEALFNDLTNLRSIFSKKDILSLKEREALAMQVRGKLGVELSLSWSDVFTTEISRLSQILDSNTPIALEISTGINVKVPITISDDFIVVYSKDKKDRIQIAVKKGRARSSGISIKVGLEAGFENSENVSEAVDALFTATLGKPLEEIKNLLAEGSSDDPWVKKALDVFGIGDVPDKLGKLQKKIDELEKTARKKLKEAVESKATIAFTYEYTRTREETTLAEVVVNRKALGPVAYGNKALQHHGALLRRKIEPLVESIRNDDHFELSRYLNQNKLTTTTSWGFNLGFGKWSLSAKTTTKVTNIKRKNIDGDLQFAYLTAREYKETAGAYRGYSWQVDFKADMPRKSSDDEEKYPAFVQAPKSGDFDFGLAFLVEWERKKLQADKLDEFNDLAAMWCIYSEADRPWAAEKMKPAMNGKPVKLSAHVTFKRNHLERIMPVVATDTEHARICEALAAGLPYWKKFDLLRSQRSRRNVYADLWEKLFDSPELTPIERWKAAARHVEHISGDLATLERAMKSNRTPGAVVSLDNNSRWRWKRLTQGAKLFAEALVNGNVDHTRIPDIFKDLGRYWDRALHLRALPVYLLGIAREEESHVGIERALRVDYKDDADKDQSIMLSKAKT